MKRIKLIMLAIVAIIAFSSCQKDEFTPETVLTHEDSSRIEYNRINDSISNLPAFVHNGYKIYKIKDGFNYYELDKLLDFNEEYKNNNYFVTNSFEPGKYNVFKSCTVKNFELENYPGKWKITFIDYNKYSMSFPTEQTLVNMTTGKEFKCYVEKIW
jgi:hypothetical protein